MREYKFRAWDKDNKEMLYQGSNTTYNNSVMDCRIVLDELGFDVLVRLYGKDEYEYRNNCELMQYTGLKDKNGTEIYEGDICNCREYECFGKIEWNEDNAGFYFYVAVEGGGFDEECLYEYADELEVIGNIHDNPELLGGAE